MRKDYLRDPRVVPFKADWRRLALLRFGFEIRKVPLPIYSASYRLAFGLKLEEAACGALLDALVLESDMNSQYKRRSGQIR